MKKHECKKCKYEWFPRVEKPKQCPNCKTQIKYETKHSPKASNSTKGN